MWSTVEKMVLDRYVCMHVHACYSSMRCIYSIVPVLKDRPLGCMEPRKGHLCIHFVTIKFSLARMETCMKSVSHNE